MYIRKNDLILRLETITGRRRIELDAMTQEELSELYEKYASEGERKYIEVPYREKNLAKVLGARFDGDLRKWYIPIGVDEKLFERWTKIK